MRLTPRATLTRFPSSSISSSVRPVSSRSAASSRTRSLSKVPSFFVIGGVLSLPPSAGLGRCEPGGERFDRKLVALGPEAADHTLYRLGDIGVVAERLAGENIRQMHLDRGNRASQQGIKHGDRGMGEGAGIDDQPRRAVPRLLDPCHQLALMVALAKVYRK